MLGTSLADSKKRPASDRCLPGAPFPTVYCLLVLRCSTRLLPSHLTASFNLCMSVCAFLRRLADACPNQLQLKEAKLSYS